MTDPHPTPRVTSGWVSRLAVVLLIVGLIAGFYLSDLHERYTWAWLRANLTDLQQTADAHPAQALLVFFLVYVLATGLSLPIAVWLTLLGGALFGRWAGTAVVSVAATVGATLAMLASRHVLHDWVQQRFGRRLDAIDRGVERDGAYYLLTLRLIPAVPFWLLNLGMGLTPIRTRTYALVSWVGMLPATFVYANAGTELGRIESPADVLTARVLGALLLLACLPLVVRVLVSRLGRRPAAG
jgi:uncharacterized membrane protein YdjX (TVP38/TMEM64 family)